MTSKIFGYVLGAIGLGLIIWPVGYGIIAFPDYVEGDWVAFPIATVGIVLFIIARKSCVNNETHISHKSSARGWEVAGDVKYN